MVYFVGAGPGDVSLITVRGQELIEKADVIIYAGSLVNPKLLKKAKKNAKIYNSANMTLEEVSDVTKSAAESGADVVRLHTGDTSLFSTISEQIRQLEKDGIMYEIVPGVSSFLAAAAALGIQYTLPEVSQSLVITRHEGRTGVPGREKLNAFAKIGCSLVLFLSASMAQEVQDELLFEGSEYKKETPCAICYKVSWEDERIIKTTLGELADRMEASGIHKTALIVVGDVLKEYRNPVESRLYSPDFSTGYRHKKKGLNASVISFTDDGRRIGEKIVSKMPEVSAYVYGVDFSDTKGLIQKLFLQDELLIIVGASGMAVRLISPFIKSKAKDPAVLCIDDTGRFVISLLSGHLGGANEWCKKIADLIFAQPVITTSTDNHGVFAVDEMAREKNLVFDDVSTIKDISSAILKGEAVGYHSDCGFNITEYLDSKKYFSKECRLYPRNIYVGMGCKAGTEQEELYEFLKSVFMEQKLPLSRICGLYSIDNKSEEKGLLELAKMLEVDFVTFSAEELNSVQGDFSDSKFVLDTVGVANVCERAAMYAATKQHKLGANLILSKTKSKGMTIALAAREL